MSKKFIMDVREENKRLRLAKQQLLTACRELIREYESPVRDMVMVKTRIEQLRTLIHDTETI